MENLPEKKQNNLPQTAQTNLLSIYTRPAGTKAIDIRRQMVTVPEVAKALNSVEKYIFAASTKTQIAEMNDQILVSKTKQLFRFIAMDVGFQVPQDADDWAYICTRIMDFLRKYYSQLTLADVKLAFELTATGELNEYLPKTKDGQPDKNHYQQFNIDYLSKILNAYKSKQSEVVHKAMKSLPEPKIEATEQQKAAWRKETINMCKTTYLFYKWFGLIQLDGLNEMFVYDWLYKIGFAERVRQTLDDRETALNVYLRRAATEKVNKFTVQQVRKDGIRSKEIDFTAYEIARKREIKKTFDRMIVKGVLITNYLY